MTRQRCRERGAATVLTLAMAGVLLLAGAAAAVVGALVVDRRTAQAAADLAALAGAATLADPGGAAPASATQARGRDPCAVAGEVADANGARLTRCVVDDADVRVEVVVTGPRWLGQHPDLRAAARAGPG